MPSSASSSSSSYLFLSALLPPLTACFPIVQPSSTVVGVNSRQCRRSIHPISATALTGSPPTTSPLSFSPLLFFLQPFCTLGPLYRFPLVCVSQTAQRDAPPIRNQFDQLNPPSPPPSTALLYLPTPVLSCPTLSVRYPSSQMNSYQSKQTTKFNVKHDGANSSIATCSAAEREGPWPATTIPDERQRCTRGAGGACCRPAHEILQLVMCLAVKSRAAPHRAHLDRLKHLAGMYEHNNSQREKTTHTTAAPASSCKRESHSGAARKSCTQPRRGTGESEAAM